VGRGRTPGRTTRGRLKKYIQLQKGASRPFLLYNVRMDYLVWSYFLLTSVIWCGFYLQAMRTKHAIQMLPIEDSLPAPVPLLSVIIAARNEAHTLTGALDKLLAQHYPRLEIIIVNDRSTDATADLINDYAARDARIRAVHIDTLPPDWMGKPHALYSATQHARGDWYLFTDADVHHSDRLWSAAIRYAMAHELDHLALLPSVTSKGILTQATTKAFGLLFLTTAKVEQIRDPESPAAIGIGAFNLIRAEKFKRSPGFEWLRMEVADDYGLALMMKADGGRSDLLIAYDDLHVEWYPDLKSMVRGLDKNIMAPGTQYKTEKLLTRPVMLVALLLAPFVSLLSFPAPTFWPGFLTLAFVCWPNIAIAINKRESVLHWLLSPVGFIIIAYIFSRACILCLVRDGICWRDTHYSRRQLQHYQRVKL